MISTNLVKDTKDLKAMYRATFRRRKFFSVRKRVTPGYPFQYPSDTRVSKCPKIQALGLMSTAKIALQFATH